MKKLMLACALSLTVLTAQAENLGEQGQTCYRQYAEALAQNDIAQAFTALKQRSALSPENLQWRYDLAAFMLDYGVDDADGKSALDLLSSGITLIEKSSDQSWKSFYLARLGEAQLLSGDPAKAQQTADAALEDYTKLQRQDRFLADIHRTLADILLAQNKAPGAVIQADQALSMLNECGQSEGITAARAHLTRGMAKLAQNDAEGAGTDLGKAKDLMDKLGLQDDPRLTLALKDLAVATEDAEGALEYAQLGLKRLESRGDAVSPDYAAALEETGAMLLSQGKAPEALECFRKAYDLNASLQGADSDQCAQDLLNGYHSACAILSSNDEASAAVAHEFLNSVAFQVTLEGEPRYLLGVESWNLQSDADLLEGLDPLPEDQDLAVLIEKDGGLAQQLVRKSDLESIVLVKTDPAEHQRLMQILSLGDTPVPLGSAAADEAQSASENFAAPAATEPSAPVAAPADPQPQEQSQGQSEEQSTAMLLNELNELDHVWDEDEEKSSAGAPADTQEDPAVSAQAGQPEPAAQSPAEAAAETAARGNADAEAPADTDTSSENSGENQASDVSASTQV